MKKYLIAAICFIWAASAFAAFQGGGTTGTTAATATATMTGHSGRTDKYGCHHDYVNGGWHCH